MKRAADLRSAGKSTLHWQCQVKSKQAKAKNNCHSQQTNLSTGKG